MPSSQTQAQFVITPLSLLTIPPTVPPKGHKVLTQMNHDINQINEAIAAYNEALDPASRIERLRQLDELQQRLGAQYSDRYVTAIPPYQQLMHEQLFVDIQAQREALQIRSDYLPQSTVISDPGSEAGEIINTMDPEQYKLFMAIIANGSIPIRDALRNTVYANDPAGDRYRAFIDAYDIEFIGGNNSRNFKFTHRLTQQNIVVRYSNNLNRFKKHEYELRARIKEKDNFMSAQWADRRTTFAGPTGSPLSGRISVMEYSVGRTLADIPWHSSKKKVQHQAGIDVSLAQILLHKKLRIYGKAWPDSKSDNIFFHRDPTSGRITATVSDNKALCAIDSNNILLRDEGGWVRTDYLSAPELRTQQAIDADKMAVYTIGKNLYEAMLLCEPKKHRRYCMTNPRTSKAVYEVDELSDEYFQLLVFFGPEGQELRGLIEETVKIDPAQRLSSDQLLQRLLRLKFADYPEYMALIDKIQQILEFPLEDVDAVKRERFMVRIYENMLDKNQDIAVLHTQLDDILSRYHMLIIEEKLDKIAAFQLDDPDEQRSQTDFIQKIRAAVADGKNLMLVQQKLDQVLSKYAQRLGSPNPTAVYRKEMHEHKGADASLSQPLSVSNKGSR